ncbi:hypothetical protein [Paenibacillus pini]|uniref:Helix-turn-helix conjugative transposon-like domain-containing protein n=1 Tax=Paenibacillus pini JCM 16418 TaxID=1236976 RepID=W7YP90_9BACL|nr:hypothetical protein [Paenibacillus pini]GAF09433.1 hypothetical protein JCM16418_3574 [Paenibacillus pini JCM 16418]
MEAKNDSSITSDAAFVKLLKLVREHNDPEAMIAILDFFEQDIVRLSRYIRIPREDAIQIITLELMTLLKDSEKNIY